MTVLSPFKNSLVEITVDSAYDETTGEATTVKHIVPAYLKEEKNPLPFSLGGVDQFLASYKGYLLDSYPVGASPVQDVNVAFNNGARGKFTLTLNIFSPFFDQVGIIGTPITLLHKV